MKHGDAPRKVLYLLFGILPSLSLLPLPLIFMRAPIGTLFFISLAAVGGCIGLCLAVFYQPSRANLHISPLIVLLLAAGSVVAGTIFFGFFLSLVREPFAANTSYMLLLLGSPLVVAAHYLKSLASGLWSKHGVACRIRIDRAMSRV